MKNEPMKTSLHETKPYITKDGSNIYELMHPQFHGNKNVSLARAIIEPGQKTANHVHKITEEIYHVVQGKGVMSLGEKVFSICSGDTICILPGTPHDVENTGKEPLIIICCCAPPYSHEDTEMQAKLK